MSLPQGRAKVAAVETMFDNIAGRYDLLNRVLTFGMDVGWRKATVASLGLGPGARVVDVACGTGDLCRELARLEYRVVGVDRSAGMLAAATVAGGLVRADALDLPVPTSGADGLVCGFALRNLVDLGSFFAECARVLRPGGRLALLEVAEPSNPVMRLGHSLYFSRVVPFIGGLVSDRAAYRYLPRSMAYLPEPSELVEMLASAGFADASRTPLSGGIAQLLCGTRDR